MRLGTVEICFTRSGTGEKRLFYKEGCEANIGNICKQSDAVDKRFSRIPLGRYKFLQLSAANFLPVFTIPAAKFTLILVKI
jgi:hypothetical protein